MPLQPRNKALMIRRTFCEQHRKKWPICWWQIMNSFPAIWETCSVVCWYWLLPLPLDLTWPNVFVVETADVVIDELEIKSKAHSLTQVANFADNIGQIKLDLNRMRYITNNLRSNASQLSDGNLPYSTMCNRRLIVMNNQNLLYQRSSWSETWIASDIDEMRCNASTMQKSAGTIRNW